MAKARIMVVEDEPVTAGLIRAALAQFEKDRPNLVLMDILPAGKMDGVETAAQIRSRFDIPVIYLTACEDEQTLKRARVTAPFGCLFKPFEAKSPDILIGLSSSAKRREN